MKKAILDLLRLILLLWLGISIGGSVAAQKSKALQVEANSHDFSLRMDPSSQTANAGDTVVYPIIIEPIVQSLEKGFGPVRLNVSGVPACARAVFHQQTAVIVEWAWNMPPPKEIAGGSWMKISTSYSCQAGSYKLIVTARKGKKGAVHETAVMLVIKPALPDFSLKVTAAKTEWVAQELRAKATVLIGGGTSYSIAVKPIDGYQGTISLRLRGDLPAGVTAQFDHPEIGGAGTSQLKVSASKSTLPGRYTLVIRAEDGSGKLVHEVYPEFIVYPAPPQFSLETSEGLERTFPGTTARCFVGVDSRFGYEGKVALSVEGLPAGVTGILDPPYAVVPDEGSGSSALKLFISNKTAPGIYVIKITGISKTGKHPLSRTSATTLTVYSSDFSMTATPEEQSVVAGDSASYVATVTPIKNGEGVVTLSFWGTFFNPRPVFIPSSLPADQGPLTSILTVSTDYWTPPGVYELRIMAANRHRSPGHDVKVMLVVKAPAPDFSLTVPNPEQSTPVGGGTAYVVNLDSIAGYKGRVSLNVKDLPAGTTASFTQDSVLVDRRFLTSVLTVFTSSSTPAGSYTLKLEGATATSDGERKHVVPLKLLVSQPRASQDIRNPD